MTFTDEDLKRLKEYMEAELSEAQAMAARLALAVEASTGCKTCGFCFLNDKLGHDPDCIGTQTLAAYEEWKAGNK